MEEDQVVPSLTNHVVPQDAPATVKMVMGTKGRVVSTTVSNNDCPNSSECFAKTSILRTQMLNKNCVFPSQSEDNLLYRKRTACTVLSLTSRQFESLDNLCSVGRSGEEYGSFKNIRDTPGRYSTASSRSSQVFTNDVPNRYGCKTFEQRASCMKVPIIVIREPSDEGEQDNTDELDYDFSVYDHNQEMFYDTQDVLIEWEDILQDFRVTDL
ncbi:hypothetical protein EGW08_010091 [Elysia chlorotica]|uniref:Uncharacterized protein n=1 Tax=Elysia chlorotica TaxID=188477 RepID=A0A3S1HM10_ELYCH|nr:hypothetical protein EGW08_010091 [Elysia chlorotica]